MLNIVFISAWVTEEESDDSFDSDFESLCESISYPFDVLPYRPAYAEWTKGGASGGPPSDMVIAAIIGAIPVAITVIYKAIGIFLKKNDTREISLEREDRSITIKGHSLPEEKELLKELFPEALKTEIPKPCDDH